MSLKRWLPLLAIAAGFLPVYGHAAVSESSFLVRTTGDLVDLCTAAPTDPLATAALNFCQGFGVGVFRVLQEQEMARSSGRLFCVPNPTPTRNQVFASFVQWARANPGQLAQPPQDGVAMFLATQYPCPAGK
jgi:hypothetical protein